MPHRLVVLLVIAALALCAACAVAGATTKTPRVARGHTLSIAIATKSLAVCVATLEYADHMSQNGAVKNARDGRVSWTIRIPRTAAIGRGTWTVRCGVVGVNGRGTFVVVAA